MCYLSGVLACPKWLSDIHMNFYRSGINSFLDDVRRLVRGIALDEGMQKVEIDWLGKEAKVCVGSFLSEP